MSNCGFGILLKGASSSALKVFLPLLPEHFLVLSVLGFEQGPPCFSAQSPTATTALQQLVILPYLKICPGTHPVSHFSD